MTKGIGGDIPPEEKKTWFSLSNPWTKGIIFGVARIFILILVNYVASEFLGRKVLTDPWFISIVCCMILDYILKQLKNEEFSPLLRAITILAVIMLFVGTIRPNMDVKKGADEIAKLKTTTNNLPRDVAWMPHKVMPSTPTRLVRVYNGDWFYYKSPENFMIIESYGQKNALECLHNKTKRPGKPDQPRKFPFFNIPPNGVDIYILPTDGTSSFEIEYKITRS